MIEVFNYGQTESQREKYQMTKNNLTAVVLKSLHLIYKTSVRQRRRPLYGYSQSAAYVRQWRRLQYGYGPTATYVRLRLQYISDAVSE